MTRFFASMLVIATAAASEYKSEPAGAPPSELAAPIASLMQKTGHKVIDPEGKTWCEVWFVAQAPSGPKTTEGDVTWATTPHGALVGALRFPAQGSDRRAQVLKPGVYTMRFSYFPINGDHQGVAPQRDFLVLTPAADDNAAEAVSDFELLMEMSRKASGTPHPAVLSMWKVQSDFKAGLHKSGEHDWALHVKIGDAQIAVILVGKAEG
jgi:hypothetical protein